MDTVLGLAFTSQITNPCGWTALHLLCMIGPEVIVEMAQSPNAKPSFWSTLHLFSMAITTLCMILVLLFESSHIFGSPSVIALHFALLLSVVSACGLILQYRIECSETATEDDIESLSGQDSDNGEVDASRTQGKRYRDWMRQSSPLVIRAVALFAVALAFILISVSNYHTELLEYQRAIVSLRAALVIFWMICIFDLYFLLSSAHSILGMVIFCLYLLVDIHELGAAHQSRSFKPIILLSLDLSGLFLQA
eukprot:CAMPEP_0113710850 /NCGR_PEP_ID=MMETSP0038_2-20120614/30405_1 /TAXON_ID=2898 /ORGANISM="Cryptomonas paramecium" /LENGTH=250 /DNA_ID=CAMNT_0000636991 /DNA_START=1 /DNA_END=749 /DNA_ORIENTATION=- /assembly_acc=CAM_ASM_000170